MGMRGLIATEGAINLFKSYSDSIWLDYNLATMPFIVYLPGEWALLHNYPKQLEEFTHYPESWPASSSQALYYDGQLGNLAGQLSFNTNIDSIKLAAVPIMERSIPELFAFFVHENFHQYQQYGDYPAFGEIPWEREERYPVEDVRNTALAYIEMRLAMDAFEAYLSDNRTEVERLLAQFIAVRKHRWSVGDPFIRRYEQGQEINEGTAAYVEKKSLLIASRGFANSSHLQLLDDFNSAMSSFSFTEHLREKFNKCLSGGSISPEDMSRNRIYPLGATLGLLADYLGIDWKTDAQKAGSEFSLVNPIGVSLGIPESNMGELLESTLKTYHYKDVLASSEQLIDDYEKGFNTELEEFENQDGWRFEITLNANGVRRARSSTAKKWLIDSGQRELRSHFNVYSLKRKGMLFQLHDSGLLEFNDWDKHIRTVEFYTPAMDSVVVDGELKSIRNNESVAFNILNIKSEGMLLDTSQPGTLTVQDSTIVVDLLNKGK